MSASPLCDLPTLRILLVTDDAHTLAVATAALIHTNAQLLVARDLTHGLNLGATDTLDLILLDVTLGSGAGLAVLHHLRTLRTDTTIVALTRPDTLDFASQATALGATTVFVLPLSGDELLTAVADLRTRVSNRLTLQRSQHDARTAQRAHSLAPALAGVVAATSRRDAAERLAVLLSQSGASRVLVYLPAGEGSRQLMRLAALDSDAASPTFCEDLELLNYARNATLEILRITLERRTVAILLLAATPTTATSTILEPLQILSPQLALTFTLVHEREQTSRGAMKDPRSSAYTFAYFVDVVGREIDKARRYSRHFALATLATHVPPNTTFPPGHDPAVEVADRVLSSVRDTDVLARVDGTEFYLLLPETGGFGAHACRRRVMHHLAASPPLAGLPPDKLHVLMGIATFPQDGTDLSQLLRLARHRADASLASPVRRLALDRLPLPEILDALLWRLSDSQSGLGSDAPHLIELPILDLVALVGTVVTEASRSGPVRVVASQRADMSIAAAVRAAPLASQDAVTLEPIDLSAQPACRDLEILIVVAQHAIYSLLGRTMGGVTRAIHSSDPILADLLVRRLGEVVGLRLLEQ